ncbi:MAG: nodulation protein NfeD [Chloroflexi bacterium]|nr:nodulation protein NfeD [Chloroflexota bacterium]
MQKIKFSAIFLLALAFLSFAQVNAQTTNPTIVVLKVDGTINPVVAGYVERGIGSAEKGGAELVIIQLDTPGGLDSAMRDIVQRIVNARIPVVVYVSPAGARAASAGTFITLAAHVAAMAPNTAIGAAHPVGISPQGTLSPVEEKVVNDAAAYIKSLAAQRGRNTVWAEQAVRASISATEQEALDLKVIDLIAPDLPSLVAQLDGRSVNLLEGQTTLHTRGALISRVSMGLVERFLLIISDPNIAYILLTLAMVGLFFELANPGAILPGVVGGISLLMALYALGTLPVNWAGVFLIGLGFLLFLAEVWVTSHGALTVGGVAALVLGSLFLLRSQGPAFEIDRRLIAAVVISISAYFIFVINAVVRAHRHRATTGIEGLVGQVAVARTPLNPEGIIFINGERWQAQVSDGLVDAGEEVIIAKIEGLKLWVTKVRKEKS